MSSPIKKCSDCTLDKELDQFTYDKSRNRHMTICRPCMAIRTEKYRQKNKDKWRVASKKSTAKWKAVVDEWKSQGCVNCGEDRIHLIDAHHIDPSKKSFSIGKTMRGVKITKLELSKCIQLCSNCHRDFHYQEKLNKITLEKYLYERQ
jgi:hypothetical protein